MLYINTVFAFVPDVTLAVTRPFESITIPVPGVIADTDLVLVK